MLLSACLFSANELHELENPPLGRLSKFIEILEDLSSNRVRANGIVATMFLLGAAYEPEKAFYLTVPIFLNSCQNLIDSCLYNDFSLSRYLAILMQSHTAFSFAKAFYNPLSAFESIALSHLSVFTGWINIFSENGVTLELLLQPLHPFIANVLEQTDSLF